MPHAISWPVVGGVAIIGLIVFFIWKKKQKK